MVACALRCMQGIDCNIHTMIIDIVRGIIYSNRAFMVIRQAAQWREQRRAVPPNGGAVARTAPSDASERLQAVPSNAPNGGAVAEISEGALHYSTSLLYIGCILII